MRILIILAAIWIALFCPAVASALEFLPWEGKGEIREGDGGTKKVVDGIEFWSNGSPPKRFILIGYINDRRHETGLVGMIRMAGLESAVSKKAKEVGGNAVILVLSESEVVGTSHFDDSKTTGSVNRSGNADLNTSVFGISKAIKKHQSNYAVIKYVTE